MRPPAQVDPARVFVVVGALRTRAPAYEILMIF